MILGITAAGRSGLPAGAIGDPFFDKVVASLHLDGTDGATTFTDVKGHSFTASGNAQLDTAQARFGTASLLLDGTDDFIKSADHADWALGSGDFTIDCWVRFNGDPGTAGMTFVSHWEANSPANQRGWVFGLNNNTLRFLYSTDGVGSTTLSVAWNPGSATWYYVSVVRRGATVYFFVDGLLLGTASIGTASIFDANSTLQIGTQSNGADFDMNGWIDDVRITKGAARYTTTFSRPVRAHYDNLGIPSDEFYDLVQSLAHFDTNLSDKRGSDWTATGGATIDASQSMFGGASLRLDGAGDWVEKTDADFAWGMGDFTIECFARFNSLSGNNFIFTFGGGWGLYRLSSNGSLGVFDGVGANPITTSVVPTTGVWYHVALCRRGTTLRLFVDGVLAGSATNSTNFTNATIRIGAQPAGTGTFDGWIDDFRATTFARYVSAFQLPLLPHPNSYGDRYFDNVVALNHWEGANGSTTYADQIAGRTWTNGTGVAALQTADFKFGASSVKLPGTASNHINSDSSASLAYGSDDFTIEFWIKIPTIVTAMLIDQRDALTQPRPAIFQQSGQLLYFVNNASVIVGGSLTNNTWQHVAVCRAAGSTRLFIDGVQTGTTWTDNTVYTQGRARLGAAGDNPTFGYHNGAYDDLRITNGTARYRGNFSPPPLAFANAA